MWEIYDTLINNIADDIPVEDYAVGAEWTAVVTRDGLGLSRTVHDRRFPITLEVRAGMPVKALAQALRSWNSLEGGLGLAAVNAYYNTRPFSAPEPTPMKDIPAAILSRGASLNGKKVAMVECCWNQEDLLRLPCQLSVFREIPERDDYPIEACPFLLPEQDAVVLSGRSIADKSFPAMLRASSGTRVILFGPDVPMAPCLFSYGVNELYAFVPDDVTRCFGLVKVGASFEQLTESGCFQHITCSAAAPADAL